jgi:bifunctional ADP-heptose synthase (sugar kinase/adenylyltransferase)
MNIANPIYDSAFKYLMEDNKIARMIIATIIGAEVVELVFSPQEHTHTLNGVAQQSFTLCRFDFSAKIKTQDGPRTVMIELQKAIQIYCIFILGDGLGIKGVLVLEIMLGIFDQTYRATEKEIRNAMECEDEVLEEFRHYERTEQTLRIDLEEKNKVIEQERAALYQKRAAAHKKDIALEQERAAAKEKDKRIAELERLLQGK